MSKINKAMKRYILGFASLMLLLASCGNEIEERLEDTLTAEEEALLSGMDTIRIILGSNDKMQFNKTVLYAWEGQVVELKLNHTGEMPITSMGHNFVLIDNSMTVSEYAKKAIKEKDNQYVLVDNPATLAATDLIGGGESTTIHFNVPSKGEYDYLCTFPGHYSVMKGKFIVK